MVFYSIHPYITSTILQHGSVIYSYHTQGRPTYYLVETSKVKYVESNMTSLFI